MVQWLSPSAVFFILRLLREIFSLSVPRFQSCGTKRASLEIYIILISSLCAYFISFIPAWCLKNLYMISEVVLSFFILATSQQTSQLLSFPIRGGSRTTATSTMVHFVIIVNGFQPLTVIIKSSILDDAAVLDLLLPPLHVSSLFSLHLSIFFLSFVFIDSHIVFTCFRYSFSFMSSVEKSLFSA